MLPLLVSWPVWARELHYNVSAMVWSSGQIAPKVCFRWPVAWIYLSRGRVAAGCVKRWEMPCVWRCNFLWSIARSRRYQVQSKRKWCTVSMVFLLQLGQWGESERLIWWRCIFSPVCPVQSCMIMEACLCDSGLISFTHFFDRTDLSILPIWRQRGELFQQQAQHCWNLDFDSWCSADRLAGRGFLRSGFIVCMFYRCDIVCIKLGFHSIYPKTIG